VAGTGRPALGARRSAAVVGGRWSVVALGFALAAGVYKQRL
jgi:hypothetical protein